MPLAGTEVIQFLGVRAIPGIEQYDSRLYRRSLSLPGGHGVVELRPDESHVVARLALEAWSDLGAAVHRL